MRIVPPVFGHVAGGEVVLLFEERIVRDVHLAIGAEHAAVGVDHGGRVAIEPRRFALVEGHHDDDVELLGERLKRVNGRAVGWLGDVEPLGFHALAEVRRVEELLQADDLRAPRGRLANTRHCARHVAGEINRGGVLNDTDVNDVVHFER